jgi:hypothetical protein
MGDFADDMNGENGFFDEFEENDTHDDPDLDDEDY